MKRVERLREYPRPIRVLFNVIAVRDETSRLFLVTKNDTMPPEASEYNELTNNFFFDKSKFNKMKEKELLQIEKKAVYPGSFDPITNGHVDIIQRGLTIFDKILVAVLENPKKEPLFSTKERISMIQEVFSKHDNIEVKVFHGLLVEFVKNNNAKIVIRGLRAVSDFEYEFQMALMNRKLDPEIETFFMMPSVSYSFLSSNLVKEVFMLGGCLKDLVPSEIEKKLREKFTKEHPGLNS